MTKTEIINAWKNPEARANISFSHPAGLSYGELSTEEMMNIQGAGDVQPETTPTTTIASSGFCAVTTIGVGVTLSLQFC
ncbi:mersacidin family lantibiotic [Rossellomorea aquimaris]|uniref:Type 2 lantibiotic (TIGR03893 family)/mersacidin/lichenicidin family type 2 lantibiotic n=1 Tax=Rossellomorea aquimaris TaxID=189382 RepID=A0A366EJG9_9BACI|nr:mersacidin family lantibiotic [Rossellomorea aquimaris]RBP02474.1 type 2 lantibiotic (TIGR03893 family)/mersacidin/lichenicidin family type 2 lantibiotic [Rossellomorea aquimaris]